MDWKSLHLYTLHRDEKDFRIFQCGVVAHNPREAASMLGGEYREPEGGIKKTATDADELNFIGYVVFHSDLFREMTHGERAVAGIFAGKKCYIKWPLQFVPPNDGESVTLAMREFQVMLPEYIKIE